VKQDSLNDAVSSCCLLLFVAVNILEHPDASFNSVPVPQSTLNSHDVPLSFRIGNLICCLLLTEVSIIFVMQKRASKFLFEIECSDM
jgi:hypothetical protein